MRPIYNKSLDFEKVIVIFCERLIVLLTICVIVSGTHGWKAVEGTAGRDEIVIRELNCWSRSAGVLLLHHQ